MIDAEFLRLLVCPATRAPLRMATAAELAACNQAIAQGALVNRGGSPVAEALQAGLVPVDGAVLYPIVDGIPILLTTEAVPLPAPAKA